MSAQPVQPGLSLFTLCALVVANSVGFQLTAIQSGFVLLALWVAGGVFAICGGLCYAELATLYGRSRGEYTFLSRIYARPVGFLAGWISVTAGFAAPMVLAAMALGSYAGRIQPWIHPSFLAYGVIAGSTVLHILVPRAGLAFQNGFTVLKVVIILAMVAAGALLPPGGDTAFRAGAGDLRLLAGAPCAIPLVFVMYAYSGWNASIYVAAEARNPRRDLPRSLVLGTLVVTVLYVGLNWAILWAAPAEFLAGQTEAGLIAAVHLLGPGPGRWMGAAIAVLLVSTVSAMVWIGPRVIQAMGEDYPLFGWLGTHNRQGVPAWAMAFQSALSALFIASGTYDRVLVYAQFSLLLCTLLAAAGVVVLRVTRPDLPRPCRAWGYPVTPAVFCAVTLWMLVYIVRMRTVESLMGFATVLTGLLVYRVSRRMPFRVPGAEE
jgi:APA family basic amino acid/polyamine antiporter